MIPQKFKEILPKYRPNVSEITKLHTLSPEDIESEDLLFFLNHRLQEQCANVLWRRVGDEIKEQLFTEFGHWYQHDQGSLEFRQLIKEWEKKAPWPEIESHIK